MEISQVKFPNLTVASIKDAVARKQLDELVATPATGAATTSFISSIAYDETKKELIVTKSPISTSGTWIGSVAWGSITSKPSIVNTLGGFSGDILLKGDNTANGTINLSIVEATNNNVTTKTIVGSIVGLGDLAFKSSLTSSDVGALPDTTTYVSTFGTASGAITVRGGLTGNGTVNLSMSGNQLQASIVGLGSYAYKSSVTYSDVGAAPSVTGGYMPKSGGQFTGKVSFKDSTAIAESTTGSYFLTMDAFSDGGEIHWISKANVKTALGLGTNAYSSTSYLPLSGGTMTGDIILGESHYVYGVNETSGSMLHWTGSGTILGSCGASSTSATTIRSVGSIIARRTATSGGTTSDYTILDTGNFIAGTNYAPAHTHPYAGTNGSSSNDFSVKTLKVGNAAAGPNYIVFYGVNGDEPGSYNHTYIGERLYGSTDETATGTSDFAELVLIKCNDTGGTTKIDSSGGSVGPDRIRHIAAAHRFLIYSANLSGSFEDVCKSSSLVTKFDIAQAANVTYQKLIPNANNTIDLGASDKKYANVYATTFSGALSGNATSATTATTASGLTTSAVATGYQIQLKGSTASSNAINSANPRIEFSDSDRSQYALLVYSDYDSVQAPDSLTLIGNLSGTYFIAPNIKATGSFYGNITGNVTGNVTGNLTGNVTGNATTATYASNVGSSSSYVTAAQVKAIHDWFTTVTDKDTDSTISTWGEIKSFLTDITDQNTLTGLLAGKANSTHYHDDRYLKLSGGTLTGNLTFSGDNSITWSRNTDSASISFKNTGDGDSDSYMWFKTTDNGNEYFRWSHTSSSDVEWMNLKSTGLTVAGSITAGGKAVVVTDDSRLSDTRNTTNSLTITKAGGTTEGTNKWTFNGSAAKSINLGTMAFDSGSYLPLSGGWINTDSLIYFKGLNSSTSTYAAIGYRANCGSVFHSQNTTGGANESGAFYIVSNGYNTHNDWGGIAIDNEGVTVFGAGDGNVSNFAGVFRVLNEDNPGDGPQFLVTKASGCTSKYSMTASGFKKSGSSDSYVLLGDGGHKALTDFSMAHSHPYASDTHNHDGRYLRYYHSNTDVSDMNAMGDTYFYCVADTGSWATTATKPSGVDNAAAVLQVHTHSGNYNSQLLIDGTLFGLWMRNAYNTTTWSDWKRFAFTGESQPASDVYSWAKASVRPTYAYGDSDLTGFGTAAACNTTAFVKNALGGDFGSSGPASSAKSMFNATNLAKGAWIYYNTPGNEYTFLMSGRSDIGHGSILRWGYPDNYLRILRFTSYTATTKDWEKISAGYADSAGNADTLDGYHYNNLPYLTSHQDISGKVNKNGSTMSGVLYWGMPQLMLRFTSNTSDNNSTGCSWYGIGTYKASDNYNWLNISDYCGINFTTRGNSYLLHNGNVIYTSANLPTYPTKESWNYDDVYLKLSGGTLSGDLYINKSTDVETGGTTGALIIGNKSGTFIGIDDNEILAQNGTSISTLYLNTNGGTVAVGGSLTVGGTSVSLNGHTHDYMSRHLGSNTYDNTAGIGIITITGNNVRGAGTQWGSLILWCNDEARNNTPSIANSGNWYNLLMGLTDDRLYFRTRTNGLTSWTSWKTIAWTSEIPTKVSQLTNDSGYLTSHQDISGKANTSGTYSGLNVGYATSAGSSSSAGCISYTGTGNGVISAYQTSNTYMGTSGWATYIICNHGDGATYYNQTIRMPFWGAPQYQRKQGGTDTGWYTFVTSENYTSYWPSSLPANGGTSTAANKVNIQDVRDATRNTSYFEAKSATFWFNQTGTPSGAWYSGIHMKGWSNGYQSWEICSGSTTSLDGTLYYRNGINDSWQSWRTVCILDTSNNLTIAGSYYANSDIRYKSLITTLDTSIESIASLPIFKYTWNDDKHDTNVHIGSSAQAVMTILPELVTKELDRDFYNLDYATLGTVAGITACKEIEMLKAKIKTLEEKIYQLSH